MTNRDDAPTPMEGGGGYNRASSVQAAGLFPALPLLREAANRVPIAPSGSLLIADYGASEGRNSMIPIRTALEVLRERAGGEREVSVAHTDLPDNDFTSLFRVLEADPESYSRDTKGIYPVAVGRSFYEQILPTASVTLGWSSWAVQWLSRVPAPIPDQVQVAFSRDPGARAAYAHQAAEDWRTFLAHRATELIPGGRLVVLTMALDTNGDFGYGPLLAAIYAALVDLAASGMVSHTEVAAMAVPTVGRSHADLLAPLADTGSFHGLRVESAEVFDGEDSIWADYEADGDAVAWAERWTAFSRASAFPTLAARIEGPDATARRTAFVAALAKLTAERLASTPRRMEIPLARLSLVRDA